MLHHRGSNTTFALLHDTADWHEVVPFPKLTGKVFIVSLQNVTFITEILNHDAMRKSSAWGGMAGVASILWLIRRLAYITTYTARNFRRPVSPCGTGEDGVSGWQITRVTAVLQYCADWEHVAVAVRQVS